MSAPANRGTDRARRRGRPPSPVGWVAAGVVVVALAVLVALHPGPLVGEVAVVRWLQDLPQPVPRAAAAVELLTGTEAALVAGAPLAFWSIVRRHRRGLAAVAVAAAAMLIVQPVLKDVVDRPRPSAGQVEVRAERESESHPSGHSLSTTTLWGAVAAVAWRRGRRRWAAVAAAAIPLAAATGMVQGAHWPSDVISGTLIGAIAARLVVGCLHGSATAPGRGERPGADERSHG